MTLCHTDITKLSSIPNIKVLLLRAALKQSSYHPQDNGSVSLPSNKFHFGGLVLNEDAGRSFHHVVGWDPKSEFIHPCYLHSLAFPLHLMLLLLPGFQLPLLGLVHVNNKIKQMRPIKNNEELSISCCFGQLELHPKGLLFSINVEFHSGTEIVWQSISTNFFRVKHGQTVEPTNLGIFRDFTRPINTPWKLNTNLGRRYAKVSGDFNPIHLTKWSAKLFGFKQHVIHGMWTKSNCISRLQKFNPSLFSQAFNINTIFKQPIYLPNEVNMMVQSFESDDIHHDQFFKVVGGEADDKQSDLHLIGNICAI